MATKPKGPAERRYHKLAVALWSDRQFRSLSDRAKLLYYRLAAGPETLPIPGVARLSRSGLALDELRWGLDDFDARLDELVQCGLAEVDLEAGLAVLPRELAEPFSLPNGLPSVTSWRRALANAPDCDLADLARERVLALLATKGARWVDTFLTPGDQGCSDDDSDGTQPGLFATKVAPSLPPKVQIQTQNQNQKPEEGASARARAAIAEARAGRPLPPPLVESVDLEDLPDLTHFAEEVRTLPPPTPPPRLPADKRDARPTPKPAAPRFGRASSRQTTLALMPKPDPEHCAAVLAGKAGKLFAFGPLLPGSSELGGLLHPAIRSEWQRVLVEYFGPLNYSQSQVDEVLAKLGSWMARRGEPVTLQLLCEFRGERLQQYCAQALAYDGGGRATASQHSASEESRRYPVRDQASRRELGQAAVVGAAQRRIQRVLQTETDPHTRATAESCLADLRALIGMRAA